MSLEIIDNRRENKKLRALGSLNNGDIFEFEDNIYLKVSIREYLASVYNAYCFNTNLLYSFSLDTVVKVLNGKLYIDE